jgi:hypothetical protein
LGVSVEQLANVNESQVQPTSPSWQAVPSALWQLWPV